VIYNFVNSAFEWYHREGVIGVLVMLISVNFTNLSMIGCSLDKPFC